jgi:hypothetical protein
MDALEELQAEDCLWDGEKDAGDVELVELSTGSTKISDIPGSSGSPGEFAPWVIDDTLGNIFPQIFQHPGDDIVFTYCQ